MNLDIKFIILASLLTACIIPLYIYRKEIFPFAYKKGDLDLFIKDLKLHMMKIHPKFNYNYSIISKTQEEKDIRVRETLIVENMIDQYFNFPYNKQTQKTVSMDQLWTGYEEKSKSSSRLPNDWNKRREVAHKRDEGKCNRCGRKINLDETYTSFAKNIEEGGGYNFENIVILCGDCNKIINSTNPSNTIHNLSLNEELMFFVES